MMPSGGGESRAEALATLAVIRHEMRTDARLSDWLARAEEEELSPAQRANVTEMKRTYTHATALPADLVAARSRAASRCEQAWRTQRADNDWQGHLPLLTEVIRLERQAAQALGQTLGLTPYDALLDVYEPGMGQERIDALFGDLEAFLPGMVDQAMGAQGSCIELQGPFAVEDQRALGLRMMKLVGFDFEHGRLDVSHHPFCGGVPRDVRMTTRYSEADFTESLMGVLHETGHAKYEQGLPHNWLDQPAGQARSMGVHESQSLLQEMQVCRGRAFLEHAAPALREAFAAQAQAQPGAFEVDNLAALYTRVSRSKIRVDADELTYPLHIMLRYRIETRLVDGSLEVADLPDAWDEGMQSLLGISTAGDYRDGCMQDVHWPSGALGYFPSYTLGAVMAAQLFAAAKRALGDVDAQIRAGEHGTLNAWLKENIWSRASLMDTDTLLRQATGASLSVDAFRAHLQQRYL